MSAQKVSAGGVAVQETISKLDADAVGIASLDDLEGSRLEEAALRLLPETRSIVVMAMEVYPEVLSLVRPGREMGAASLNDLWDRNGDFLYGRLTKSAYDVARASRRHGFKALPLPASGCPMDGRFLEAVFSYKHAGQKSGLGYIGRNSLLINPDLGPRMRLSSCLTEAELEATEISANGGCKSCRICIDKCPAGALSQPQDGQPYSINKFACSFFFNKTLPRC